MIKHARLLQIIGIMAVGLVMVGCRTFQSTLMSSSSPITTTIEKTLPPVSTSKSELDSYWPTGDWRTSTPEQQGIDSEQLVEMLNFIQKQRYDIHSILIVRNGYVVMDAYFYPFQPETKHYIVSCTKSFVSALIGIAIDKGYIDDVNHKILDFFSERTIANNDLRKQSITIEHLLTMSSGFYWSTKQCTELMIPQMLKSEDCVQFILDQPMVSIPGSQWNYNSGGSHLLSAILQKTTGMNSLNFAQRYLFEPLGIDDVAWLSDKNGINFGGWGMEMMPRDMAKFGYLYLRNGVWGEKQIVPIEWIKVSTTPQGPVDVYKYYQYGYQWWIYPPGNYYARGYGGQCIFVMPNQEMVVVLTCGLNERMPDTLLDCFIIPSLKSSEPLPKNPEQVALLESQIKSVSNPQPEPVSPLSAMAQSVSGKRYILETNSLGIESFSLSFSEEKSLLKWFFEDNNCQELMVGLDNVYRINRVDQFRLLVALKGYWEDEDIFLLSYLTMNGKISSLRFYFDKKGVMIQLPGEIESISGIIQD